ncbi:terminase small subunit [Sporosarcina sp. FSL K6-6792]|uniref:terminase small subunit n=1 Tax=Sporosarcina sp. FSL K6-6792 TaxID=2921559 RepID=UPI0030F9110B
MPNWEEIQREWETSEISFKDLAEKNSVKDSTIRSRKNREKWSRGNVKRDATKNATQRKNVATKKVVKEVFVESDDLTDRQRLFCIYYIKSFNATMAAIKAGYARNSAHVEGSRLLRNVKVAAEVRRLKGEMHQEVFITAMDVLNKYIQIAFADMTDFVEFGSTEMEQRHPETGKVMLDANFKPITYKMSHLDFKNDDEVDGTIISEVKQGKDGVSIKLASREKAMDFLSKHFDMLPDHFKRQLEQEKLKIAHAKAFGNEDPEQFEDDGFNEALDATTLEVWGDAGNPTESDD